MQFNISLFLAALGLAFVLEALPWLLAPDKMRAGVRQLLELPPQVLRFCGFALLAAGIVCVALSRLLLRG